VEGLGDVVRGAHARGFHGAFDGAVLGEHHHRGLRMGGPQTLEQFNAAHLGHTQIGEDDIDGKLFDNFQGLFSGGSCAGAQSGIDHHVTAEAPGGVFVVNDEDGNRDRAFDA
jgi:hypothetical protein